MGCAMGKSVSPYDGTEYLKTVSHPTRPVIDNALFDPNAIDENNALFFNACHNGDLDQVLNLLDEDINPVDPTANESAAFVHLSEVPG